MKMIWSNTKQQFSKFWVWNEWSETENMWTYWNLLGNIHEITSAELIFGGY